MAMLNSRNLLLSISAFKKRIISVGNLVLRLSLLMHNIDILGFCLF